MIEIRYFYEPQSKDLGDVFVSSILKDIEKLGVYGGIHEKYLGYYKYNASKFFVYFLTICIVVLSYFYMSIV